MLIINRARLHNSKCSKGFMKLRKLRAELIRNNDVIDECSMSL